MIIIMKLLILTAVVVLVVVAAQQQQQDQDDDCRMARSCLDCLSLDGCNGWSAIGICHQTCFDEYVTYHVGCYGASGGSTVSTVPETDTFTVLPRSTQS